MKNMKKRSSNQSGFTLLELLMVVIIIAILAAIAVPSYFRTAERSRAAEALQVLASIRGAQLRYYAQNGAYAAASTSLDVEVPVSQMWSYTVNSSGNGIAARVGAASNTVTINYGSGNVCTSNTTTYGLPATC